MARKIVGRKDTAQLYVGITETLTTDNKIGHLTTFQFPQIEKTEIDVTDFDSDGKEVEYGTADYGTLEVSQRLTSEEYNTMQEWCDNDTELYMQAYIIAVDGSVAVGRKFKGLVQAVALEGVEIDSSVIVNTTIKINGKSSKVEALPSASSVDV